MAEETGKLRVDMANLRSELKGDIANLRAELKGDIASQTKWIVVTFLGVAAFISVVLPFMWKLADKLVR